MSHAVNISSQFQQLSRILGFALLLITCWSGSSPLVKGAPSNAGVPTQMNLHNVEMRIIQRTNEMRARHGRPPLTIDMSLVNSARRHANWMVRNRRMQHGNAPVAENIAMGQHSTEQVVNDWMNSPGHRANILNPQHRRIGVAAYRAADGTVYWCQQFTR